jgi:SAM-dependent methyltransferase
MVAPHICGVLQLMPVKAAKRHPKSAAASRDGKLDAWIDDVPGRFQPDPELAYEHLIRRVRDVIVCVVPNRTTTLIVSEGDDDFLNPSSLLGRRAQHFPQNEMGGYVGHPANGHAAVAALEQSRERGAQFLVIPANSAWWLERYPELARHLEQNCFKITAEPGTCDIYGLSDETIPNDRELHSEPESGELRPIRSIAPADQGYKGDPEFYFRWGWHGLRSVEQALRAARKETVESILDLPSGHGRILRMLKARFPDAKLTACDIDRDGVDFCAEVLGATPVYSAHDSADIVLPDTYDLIWCGSLLTHLAGDRWRGFLELFTSHLSEGGVLVFTTHGRLYSELLRHDALQIGLPDPQRLVSEFDRDGFAYQDYTGVQGFGFSLSSPSWVCRELEQHPRLRLLLLAEHAWGNYQDVVGCIRVPDDEMEDRVATRLEHLKAC